MVSFNQDFHTNNETSELDTSPSNGKGLLFHLSVASVFSVFNIECSVVVNYLGSNEVPLQIE